MISFWFIVYSAKQIFSSFFAFVSLASRCRSIAVRIMLFSARTTFSWQYKIYKIHFSFSSRLFVHFSWAREPCTCVRWLTDGHRIYASRKASTEWPRSESRLKLQLMLKSLFLIYHSFRCLRPDFNSHLGEIFSQLEKILESKSYHTLTEASWIFHNMSFWTIRASIQERLPGNSTSNEREIWMGITFKLLLSRLVRSEMSFYETKWDDGVRQDFIFTIQRY